MHRDTSQTRVTLKEVVEVAKTFEATTYATQLMKTTRSNQEQVNYTCKPKNGRKRAQQSYLVIGALVDISNLDNNTAPPPLHMAKDATNAESSATSLHELARTGQVIRESIRSPAASKAQTPLQWTATRQSGNSMLIFICTWWRDKSCTSSD